MIKKQKSYTAEFKTKVVLELLAGDLTVSQIASKHSIIGKSLLPNVVTALRAMASCQSKHDPAMQSGCDKKLSEGKYRQRIAGARALGHEG